MTHYAVIGRIPFDDEDGIIFYESDETSPPLVAWFERDMFELSNRTDQEAVRKELGCDYAVYINHILTSQTPFGYF